MVVVIMVILPGKIDAVIEVCAKPLIRSKT